MTSCGKCSDFAKMAKERVLIESQSLVADALGGQTNTWTTVGTYWAWVRPVSDNERLVNEQLRGEVSHKIVIRYQSALANVANTASYRLTLDSRVHQIVGIKNLAQDMKTYGTQFQELKTIENAVEND